jgi:hypothetical protein
MDVALGAAFVVQARQVSLPLRAQL